MPATTNQSHKVAKGETLAVIAKKHGHRDWKAIWNATPNRGIVSQRKKPEAIQPGDVLVIPPTESQGKEQAGKREKLVKAREMNVKIRTALQAEIARCAKGYNVVTDLIPGSVRYTQDIVKGLEADLNSMKNWGAGVDAAKEVLTVVIGPVFKLTKLGAKAAGAAGAELSKIGREAATEVASWLKEKADEAIEDKAKEEAGKILKDALGEESAIVESLKIISESYEKMGSPSFWASTFVAMKDGKSWSEATTRELGDDIRDRIKLIEAQHDKNIHRLYVEQKKLRAGLDTRRALLKACEARIKELDDKIKAAT